MTPTHKCNIARPDPGPRIGAVSDRLDFVVTQIDLGLPPVSV
jgi:hypothetical protein